MEMDKLEDEREKRYATDKSEGIETAAWHAFHIGGHLAQLHDGTCIPH